MKSIAPADSHIRRRTGLFYRIKLCPHLQAGECFKGQSCRYAHEEASIASRKSLRKTMFCRSWQLGECLKSPDECSFAHGVDDLACDHLYKTSMCDKITGEDICPFGERCHKAHTSEERRTRVPVCLKCEIPLSITALHRGEIGLHQIKITGDVDGLSDCSDEDCCDDEIKCLSNNSRRPSHLEVQRVKLNVRHEKSNDSSTPPTLCQSQSSQEKQRQLPQRESSLSSSNESALNRRESALTDLVDSDDLKDSFHDDQTHFAVMSVLGQNETISKEVTQNNNPKFNFLHDSTSVTNMNSDNNIKNPTYLLLKHSEIHIIKNEENEENSRSVRNALSSSTHFSRSNNNDLELRIPPVSYLPSSPPSSPVCVGLPGGSPVASPHPYVVSSPRAVSKYLREFKVPDLPFPPCDIYSCIPLPRHRSISCCFSLMYSVPGAPPLPKPTQKKKMRRDTDLEIDQLLSTPPIIVKDICPLTRDQVNPESRIFNFENV
eukprot:GDKJ01058352.1.p1 GENE.GDKJ01058352.1~~GDKJ01058352.1.p1  ORF type:complete len:508 (+),score=92.76 GDKJ01058352.1:56-1525(+)